MNLNLIESVSKLIGYSCGWRNSFYRRYPNGHHTPMIKYFEFTIDTRDMSVWLVSLDRHGGKESFRLDEANFKLLIDYIGLPTSDDMNVYLNRYKTDERFEIYNYKFTIYKNEEDFYFITADTKE